MPVYMTALCEKTGRHIGHAFGYYDYEQKTGMTVAFSGKEATANYICACVRRMLRGGLLYATTSERGEGYIAFAEGDRLGEPVILETDAKSKCDKYVHLGMELAGVRDIGEFGKLYDLIKYPNTEKRQPGLNRLRQPLDGWRISIHAEKTKPHITSLFVGAEKIHVKKDQYRRGRFFPCGSWQIRNREYSITL